MDNKPFSSKPVPIQDLISFPAAPNDFNNIRRLPPTQWLVLSIGLVMCTIQLTFNWTINQSISSAAFMLTDAPHWVRRLVIYRQRLKYIK